MQRYHDARRAHFEDPSRRELLHKLYASMGRANDAVMAGDRRAYEKEVSAQATIRGQMLKVAPESYCCGCADWHKEPLCY